MINYGITVDSLVIVKRNGEDVEIPITEVRTGDFIKGYSRNEQKDVYNLVVNIQTFQLAEEDYGQLWYYTSNENLHKLLCGKAQEFDHYDNLTKNWQYEQIQNLMSTNIIKGYSDETIKIGEMTIEKSKWENDNFIMFTLTNSYNFYVRNDFYDGEDNIYLLARGKIS